MVLAILLKIVLMLVATPGMIAPAANCHETRHQSILNEVLASSVLPNSQLPNQIGNPCHLFLLSPRRIFFRRYE